MIDTRNARVSCDLGRKQSHGSNDLDSSVPPSSGGPAGLACNARDPFGGRRVARGIRQCRECLPNAPQAVSSAQPGPLDPQGANRRRRRLPGTAWRTACAAVLKSDGTWIGQLGKALATQPLSSQMAMQADCHAGFLNARTGDIPCCIAFLSHILSLAPR
jgi:hypothetical protein